MGGGENDSVVRLRSGLLSSISLAAIASCVAAACSGSAGGSYYGDPTTTSSDPLFPYAGPTCPDGPPGTEADVPCGKCEERACASTYGCVTADCSQFYECACACQYNDINCQNACPLSQACQSCIQMLRACSERAGNSPACSAACSGI